MRHEHGNRFHDAQCVALKVISVLDAVVGINVAPARAITLAEYATKWIKDRPVKARTRLMYESLLTHHIKPSVCNLPIDHVTADRVRSWYAGLGSEHTRRNSHAYGLLHAVMATAVKDVLLRANPCQIERVMNPQRKREPVILTVVLDELEAAGVTIDRYAGTSMGAIIAGLAATGRDAAAVDATIYEYFIRSNPTSDYTLPSKGLIRGRRTLAALRNAFGGQLVEELPHEFRCVSVDLLERRPVVHRSGSIAHVVGCSLRVPGLYAPVVYDGSVHVDGGVLDNLPVAALGRADGPLIAVTVDSGQAPSTASASKPARAPRVPSLVDTLMRTMTISSAMASAEVLAHADLAIHADTSSIGFLEWHQIDRAREIGRVAAREALPQIMELVQGSGFAASRLALQAVATGGRLRTKDTVLDGDASSATP